MRPLLMAALICVALNVESIATVPATITVQGRLTNASDVPLSAGIKQFTFRIFSASSGGAEVWPGGTGELQFIVSDAAGLWTAAVGAEKPLTDVVFSDTVRWLEITVTDGIMAPVTLPRIRLVTGPYAFRVATVDGASGGSITSKVAIGPGTSNTGVNAFAAGESNTASGNWSSVAGGIGNIADDTGSVVSGGGNNRARGRFSIVAGGGGTNPIDSNLASAPRSTIVGGTRNVASSPGAFVGGGFRNLASNGDATVAGGSQNTASGFVATVSGGILNTANGQAASVGGGIRNYALGHYSTIAGGGGSTGADSNLATGEGAAIVGGSRHVASGRFSTIGGGLHNHADGDFSTIAGGGGSFPGDSNVANGLCATVPGGTGNWAFGNYSLAAGRRAKALHDGSFVWGDSTDADITTTAANQFIIRASNGVGIGTSGPESPLHVREGSAGAVTGNANAAAIFERNGECWIHLLAPDANQSGLLFGSPTDALMGSIRFNAGGNRGLDFRVGSNDSRLILDSCGNLTADGNVVGLGVGCASDARFKRNIETLSNALGLVERLRGVRYEWEKEMFADREFPSGEQVGLIAQEVREVIPQAVIEQADGYLAVDYARLVPLLIEGMKEQQYTIDELKERLARLESRP